MLSLVLPLSDAISEEPSLETPESGTNNGITPSSFIEQDDVRVFQNHVTLNVPGVKWAKFEDTGSMLPVINKDSYALQVEPACPNEISVGDIVSYKKDNRVIIHRVVHKDEDEEGAYFVLKGDNNPVNDPGRVRCDQIDRKVIAILY